MTAFRYAPVARTVVFDLDGVLADNTAALADLRANARPNGSVDWSIFHKHKPTMPVIRPFATLLRMLYYSDHFILILTNRAAAHEQVTREWLKSNAIPYDLLRLRDAGVPPEDSKGLILDELAERGHEYMLALDDDPMNQQVFIERDIPFIYVPSGYYDAGRTINDDHLAAGVQ